MTVTDDTERLASNLPAALGDLVPNTFAHLTGSVGELSREADDLGKDELGDGPRVGEGRVEDGDTSRGSGGEVDLVGTDTEATNDEKLSSMVGESSKKDDKMISASAPQAAGVT